MLQVKLDRFQSRAYEMVQPGRVCVFPFGRGSGKTYLGRVLIHSRALVGGGRHVGLLMPSLKQARAVFWPGLLADFHDLGAQVTNVNKTVLEATYANGSRLTTWGAENAESIRGQRFTDLIQDEADDIHPDVEAAIVEPTFSRSGVEAVWAKFGTPRMGRFGGLYRDYARAEAREISASGARKYYGFKVSSEDSPQVDQVWLADVRANLLASQPAIYHREYRCDFDAADGTVYPFKEAFHKREINPQTRWSEILIGVDHGYEHPGVFVVILVAGNGRDAVCHVVEEVYKQHQVESWWIEQAQRLQSKYPTARWYADPSQPARIEALKRGAKINIIAGENAIDDGVSAVADRLGIRSYADGSQSARLYVSAACPNAIREFSLYKRKRDPKNKELVLDDIEKKNDDLMDALRYAIFTRFGSPPAHRHEVA